MKVAVISFLLAISFISPSWATKGIAFVHGTGKHTNALDDYWTKAFVKSVNKSLPDPDNHIVVNCDFNQLMSKPEAVGCLADHLTPFINKRNITELVVITHSNGGNIIRWLESNPVSDTRFPNIINSISEVIALAPSSLGTPLADKTMNGNAIQKGIGWITGYQSEAIRQQQVGNMANYNANNLYGTANRPPLPKPFKVVVGSGLGDSWNPFSDDYTCAGAHYQAGLKAAKIFGGLDACSDGFLNCSSQAGAGEVWFRDREKTSHGYLLSHHQSRRDCFNLDKILRKHIRRI